MSNKRIGNALTALREHAAASTRAHAAVKAIDSGDQNIAKYRLDQFFIIHVKNPKRVDDMRSSAEINEFYNAAVSALLEME